MDSRRRKPNFQIEIARERIDILFEQAEKRFKEDPQLSDRYVKIARKIGMKFNVPIPSKYKSKFCRKCNTYWMQGKTSDIIEDEEFSITKCKICGNERKVSKN